MTDLSEDDVVVLRAELEKKQHELKQLQDSFDEYTQSSQELEQELEAELARMEQKNATLDKRVHVMEEELTQTRGKLDATLQEMRKCENELMSLRGEISRVLSIKRDLEQETDELNTQVRILQATEEDLRHKMEREIEEKVFLLSDQEELKLEHELVTERLRTEIMDLKSEIFALRQKNDALRVAKEEKEREETESLDDMDVDYTPRLSLQERDENDREQLIDTLQSELDVLSVRLQEEIEAREQIESEFVAAQESLAQVDTMEAEMMEMSDELIEKSQEIRQRDLEIQSLQETVEELKATNTELLEENATLKAAREDSSSNEAVVEQLRNLEAQCEDLEAAEQAARERLEDEQRLNQELREQIDDIEGQLADNARLRVDLEARLSEQKAKMQLEIDELKEQNESVRRELDTASRKAADLERVTTTSTTSSSTMSSTPSSPVTKPAASPAISKETPTDPRRFVLEIQSLRANINSLQAEISRLRNNESGSPTLLPNKRVSTDLLKINYTPDQLANKYLAERTRNAALLSRLQTVCGNIQVFCRVRPVIDAELESNYGTQLAVNMINQSDVAAIDVRPDRIFPDGNQPPDANTGDLVDLAEVNASWKVFTFDRVIGPSETQVDVFREVEPIAQSVVEGFKACIFAYGQTGSGKTHTMEGSESDPGLNYRVVNHIFQSIVLRGSIYDPERAEEDQIESEIVDGVGPSGTELAYHIQVGVLEIYNESLRDLVDPSNSKPLEIRHDTTSGDICVPELTMATVASPEQTIELLRRAQGNRVTGKTDMNSHSSRSHSVVIIQISTRTASGPNPNELLGSYVSGKLYLVDLAGSERVKKSNVSGAMLREAAHINKSLSALADVMEALDKKQQHVPYRNSKLTHLLQDVLNSACKTVMIVNVGPTLESANETFRSLQLAERVRHVVVGRNSIVKNKQDIVSAKRAFTEIQGLKQQLQISARKFKQLQQTVVTLKRDQKGQSDKVTSTLETRAKAAEGQAATLRTQTETLKRLNDDLTQQLRQEREAKQKEVEQRETAQKMLRQVTSKNRVSSTHQESLERVVKDREDEIKKLRQMLTEARQRTTTSVIPRHKQAVSNGTTANKKARTEVSRVETQDNQEEHAEDGDEIMDDESTVSSSTTTTSATRIPAPRGRLARQPSVNSSTTASIKKSAPPRSDSGVGGVSKIRRINSTSLNGTSTSSTTSSTASSSARRTWR
ncbi:hypothetical protein Poli38472_006693 [Pythium oligandrum]|uniref:Kinesin motor domain-containing protein n=1 Tax=Pythium oligandrum TaxID=41045 RepID=A0A8K1FFD2_PYTOL|nr:hypothetical protein Poli38472_006693 [Pythium oligandrum]|eukprot:TMW56683.1 hypothetical protein Poli38472_006693 [Pythium oligandrum]